MDMTTPTKRDRSIDSSSGEIPENKRPTWQQVQKKWIMRNLPINVRKT